MKSFQDEFRCFTKNIEINTIYYIFDTLFNNYLRKFITFYDFYLEPTNSIINGWNRVKVFIEC